MLFCCNKVVKPASIPRKNLINNLMSAMFMLGISFFKKRAHYAQRQRDLERGFGVKIISDSVFSREGMRSEVLRIDFHFTSRAESLSLRLRPPKCFGLPQRRVTETPIRSEKQSEVNPIRRRVTRALGQLPLLLFSLVHFHY